MERTERLLDRSTYLPRTLSTFEVVASYFVDFYYNALYNEAVKFRESGKVPHVADGYRHTVYHFTKTIDHKSPSYNPKFYTRMLGGINQWFSIHTSFSSLNMSECIEKITREFIPDDFFDAVDKDQRRCLLREILSKIIREFSKAVLHDYIKVIIDSHSDSDNVAILKEKVVDLLLIERDLMYQRFTDANGGPKRKEMVDVALMQRMRQELEKQIREKLEWKQKATDLEEVTQKSRGDMPQLYKELRDKNMHAKKLQDGIDLRYTQIREQTKRIAALEDELSAAKRQMEIMSETMRRQPVEPAPSKSRRTVNTSGSFMPPVSKVPRGRAQRKAPSPEPAEIKTFDFVEHNDDSDEVSKEEPYSDDLLDFPQTKTPTNEEIKTRENDEVPRENIDENHSKDENNESPRDASSPNSSMIKIDMGDPLDLSDIY